MAELNQNKKSKKQVNLFLIGNTVAYSSKQLFIIAPQICCTKSIGNFPKKVAHASFLQCLAYIVLGQDDCLRKISLKSLQNQSQKNQVKHGKYGSIMLPHIFPWKSLGRTLGEKGTSPPHPETYPQNLSVQFLVVRGSKNRKGGGGSLQISPKEKPSQSHIKCYLG